MAVPLREPRALGVGAESVVTHEVAGLSDFGRAIMEVDGGQALVVAGVREPRGDGDRLFGPSHEMRGLAFRGAPGEGDSIDVELALRLCTSAQNGCSAETCGAAVLDFTSRGVLMEGVGRLATPAAVTGFFEELRRGLTGGRLRGVRGDRDGWDAAVRVWDTGHEMGPETGGSLQGISVMDILASAVKSLHVRMPFTGKGAKGNGPAVALA